jgi:hypothetical protein
MKVEAERTDPASLDGLTKEPAGMDADGFKRAVGTMRLVITFFLILDFALACFVAVKFFEV